ncbi:hypothetical protein PanWU01x14_077980 [Parasponia andersonii]|uniref:Uncharacterized protein n=1 Tax=Parasponia andersonii TaxID=3476 RepID=A0A2P5DBX3_PARAD|nr:hypothetical protein PanWU01x14_077980 [Parasponia andersonii]
MTCPLCNLAPESVLHLFRDCVVVRILWFRTPWSIHSNEIDRQSIEAFIRFLLDPIKLRTDYCRSFVVMQATVRSIESLRNPIPENGAHMTGDEIGVLNPGWLVYKFDSALYALDVELKAIHMALMATNDLGWKRIMLFSDVELAVKALSNGKGPHD